jgi:hypothetical protein
MSRKKATPAAQAMEKRLRPGEKFEVPSPLSSPQHRRHLREAARLELREWETKWLRMGTDPESMAEACEGARVRLMSEARGRGRQG